MAKQNINGFEFDDTLDIGTILGQHHKFASKQAKDEKEKEFKVEMEKARKEWEDSLKTKTEHETLLNSIKDETSKKVVEKLLEKGIAVDEINKEFPDLLKTEQPNPKPNNEGQPSLNDVLKMIKDGKDPEPTLEELKAKKIADLTPAERERLIQERAKEIEDDE